MPTTAGPDSSGADLVGDLPPATAAGGDPRLPADRTTLVAGLVAIAVALGAAGIGFRRLRQDRY